MIERWRERDGLRQAQAERVWVAVLALLALVCLAVAPVQAQERRVPYWASITAGEALMRTGPGRQFPATWKYVRRGLPLKVVEVHQAWRRVQDPDGTTGWMLAALLTADRTAIVRGDGPRPMHAERSATSAVRFQAQPGVVGRITDCSDGWCLFDVGGRQGHIRYEHVWGVEPGESF